MRDRRPRFTNNIPGFAPSPDGNSVVYRALLPSGSGQLFIRRLDEVEPLPLKGAVEAVNPFYSPDGKWIGFWTLSKLAKMAVEGEAAEPIAKIGGPFEATWTTHDEIVLGSSGEGLVIVSANGGAPRPLTHIDSRPALMGATVSPFAGFSRCSATAPRRRFP